MGAFTKVAIFETRIFFETRCSWVKKRITDFRFLLRFYIFPLTDKVLCVLLGGRTSSDEAKTLWGLCWLLEGKQALRRLLGQKLCVGSVGCWRNLEWPYNDVWPCIAGAFTNFAIFENRNLFETSCSWVKKRLTNFRFFSVFIYNIGNNKVLCVLLGGEQALTRQRLCGSSVGCWRGNKPWRGCWGKGSVWRGSEMSSKPFLGYVLRARLLNSQFSKTAFFLKRGATEWKQRLHIFVFLRFYI